MNTILVPTDFSANATKALDFAVQLAKTASAKIIIVHSCDLRVITFRNSAGIDEKYNQQTLEEADKQLTLLKESIGEAESIIVQTQLYDGSIRDTIPKAASEFGVDLIVMGTLGNSAFKEKVFGSTTAAIMSQTTVPVLAIPLLSDWHVPETILLTVNEFEEIPGTTAIVFELAELFKARLYIVVFTDKDGAEASDYIRDERNISAYKLKLQARYKNITIEALHLDGSKFQETISRYTEEQGIDILAMITHNRKFPENIFRRSATRRMSYHSNIPLLALPAQAI